MSGAKYDRNRWIDRGRTQLIIDIAAEGGLSNGDIAKYLNTSVSGLYLKKTNNRFTIDDLMAILYACDNSLKIVDRRGKLVLGITPYGYFKRHDENRLEYLQKTRQKLDIDYENKMRAEYESLKTRLESMKEDFGFED